MKSLITKGEIYIGIEFGSTRIKSVLIDEQGNMLATGGFDWENQFVDGIWTYDQDLIWKGLQGAYQSLVQNVQNKYQCNIRSARGIGISGMMHGYMPFDRKGNLLTPFRTWRNNITQNSAKKLTALFHYNIPQRWSIAHLYQSILNKESHLSEIDYLTTLAGYVHWQLTGEKVIGIGDASGMFPIDIEQQDFSQTMLIEFNQLIAKYNFPWQLEQILPKVLVAGKMAGKLTEFGAKLLDPTGNLQAGIPFCPPEGDAGTGMVATNSIKENTGNISAGTSAFAMIVLEKALSQVYEELDLVTTPTGKLVAMAHANNCSSDINAWVGLFGECLTEFGCQVNSAQLYETLFKKAMQGEADCGGLLSYGFYSGEHAVGLTSGCPTFLHPTNANFTLSNFLRVHLYTAFGAMKLGMDILQHKERIKIHQILAHGGIFKTQGVAQSILASALNVPVATMKTAGDGGAWGVALLASYLSHAEHDITLPEYLDKYIFRDTKQYVEYPDITIHQGYQKFMQRYQQGIEIVRTASQIEQ